MATNNESGLAKGLKIGSAAATLGMGLWLWIDSKTHRTKTEALKSASK
jgi:hypothetical protein